MRQSRRAQQPLIESLPEPEHTFHRRRQEHKQLMANQPNMADLLCQLEEMQIAVEASATREWA